MSTYDDWKTTDPSERNWRECPECGEQVHCLDAACVCGWEHAEHEPDPDALYDEWIDRQMGGDDA